MQTGEQRYVVQPYPLKNAAFQKEQSLRTCVRTPRITELKGWVGAPAPQGRGEGLSWCGAGNAEL